MVYPVPTAVDLQQQTFVGIYSYNHSLNVRQRTYPALISVHGPRSSPADIVLKVFKQPQTIFTSAQSGTIQYQEERSLSIIQQTKMSP
jgi:hypothetical protein